MQPISIVRRAEGAARAGPSLRWTVDAVAALLALPMNDLAASRAADASRAPRSQRRPAFDAAVDQDRRLSRGLRLLPAGRALSHRRRQPGAARARRRHRRGGRSQGRGRDAILHGRRVARPEGARSRTGAGDGARGQGAGAGNLRDAGHAQGRPGRAAARCRARLLQPQPRLPRRSSTARSSPRATTATGSTRSSACARPACGSAAAASSAWANRARSAPA